MDCCLEIPGYFTSQRQAEHLRRLRREFPFVYIHELTRTAYGRPIHALQIGSGDRKVLLTAGHHANETITSEVLWRFLFTYCKALRAERTVCGAAGRYWCCRGQWSCCRNLRAARGSSQR